MHEGSANWVTIDADTKSIDQMSTEILTAVENYKNSDQIDFESALMKNLFV